MLFNFVQHDSGRPGFQAKRQSAGRRPVVAPPKPKKDPLMSTHHRPYAIRLKAAPSAFTRLPAGSDPEAFIARQEAMIQAGTHALIAEKLALDAVRNQAEREHRLKPAARTGEVHLH